jgi:hypothetical protein
VTTSFFLLTPAIIRVLLALAGLVFVGLRARGVARGLGMTACALLVLSGLTAATYALAVPLVARGGATQTLANLGVLTLVGSIFQLVGIALLIVAVCLRPSQPATGATGYPPPPQPYAGPVPPPRPGGPGASPGSY